jgi:hypothetical protein
MVVSEWNQQLAKNVSKISPNIEPICQIDAFEQVAWELRGPYNLKFKRPRKMKVEEQIAFLRNCFELDKIEIIESACPQLMWQLEKGVWNTKKSDFVRTQAAGHLDLLMCLAYTVHAVPWNKRPGQTTIEGEMSQIGKKFHKEIKKKPKVSWGDLT